MIQRSNINFYLKPELKDKFSHTCIEERCTKSELFRVFVAAFVEVPEFRTLILKELWRTADTMNPTAENMKTSEKMRSGPMTTSKDVVDSVADSGKVKVGGYGQPAE